jgi:hypothetical protein
MQSTFRRGSTRRRRESDPARAVDEDPVRLLTLAGARDDECVRRGGVAALGRVEAAHVDPTVRVVAVTPRRLLGRRADVNIFFLRAARFDPWRRRG